MHRRSLLLDRVATIHDDVLRSIGCDHMPVSHGPLEQDTGAVDTDSKPTSVVSVVSVVSVSNTDDPTAQQFMGATHVARQLSISLALAQT